MKKSQSKSKRQIAEDEEQEIKERMDSFLEEKRLVLEGTDGPIKPQPQLASTIDLNTLQELNIEPIVDGQCPTTVIGICGAASSGKTYIAGNIKDYFKKMGIKVTIVKERDFLLPINIENKDDKQKYISEYDFDHIDAVDWKLFEKSVQFLKDGRPFNSPIFDIFNSKRILKTKKMDPAELLIIEGRLFLNNEFLRNSCNIKLFLDTDLDILLSRIVFKEMAKKTDLTKALDKYTKFIKPSYERFIESTKKYADLVIHNFAGTNFDFEQVDHSFEVLKIIHDLIKFRVKYRLSSPKHANPPVFTANHPDQ